MVALLKKHFFKQVAKISLRVERLIRSRKMRFSFEFGLPSGSEWVVLVPISSLGLLGLWLLVPSKEGCQKQSFTDGFRKKFFFTVKNRQDIPEQAFYVVR